MHPKACDVVHRDKTTCVRMAPEAEGWAKQAQISFGRLLAVLKQQTQGHERRQRQSQSQSQSQAHKEPIFWSSSSRPEDNAQQAPGQEQLDTGQMVPKTKPHYPQNHHHHTHQKPLRASTGAGPSMHYLPGIFKSHKYLRVKRRGRAHATRRHVNPTDMAQVFRETPQELSQRLNAAVAIPCSTLRQRPEDVVNVAPPKSDEEP